MFASATIIEALNLHEGTLVFRSRRDFSLGKKTAVKVALPPGSGKVVSLDVEICAREEDGATSIYTAKVLSPIGHLEVVSDDPLLRAASRTHIGIRVMSKDLPRYRAMTVDFSASEAQLETDAAVPLGKKLALELDLDNYAVDQIHCAAEVAWCRPVPLSEHFRVGVRFRDNSPQVAQQLRDLEIFLESRSHADLKSLLEKSILLPVTHAAPVQPRVSASPASGPESPEPGILLPLQAFLQSYSKNHLSGSLVLTFAVEKGPPQQLEFRDCHYFLDLSAAQGQRAVALRSRRSSELLSQLAQKRGGSGWKHYQLLDEGGKVILEIASSGCRPLTD